MNHAVLPQVSRVRDRNLTGAKATNPPRGRARSGDFHFEFVAFDVGALELGDDAVGVFGCDVHKEVPLADVHCADDFGGQSRLAEDGSDENSYKVVTTLRTEQGVGRGSNAYILVINEYRKSAAKPFTFVENDQVYFGTCVHF